MMDHAAMGHGGMKHGDMDHGSMCRMNMVFTWETQNLCIIFPQWQITDTLSLIWSLCIIVLVTAGYELLRNASRRYEARCAQLAIRLPDDDHEDPSSLIHPGKPQTTGRDTTKPVRAAFYTAQVLYSFFIMLLFMTYNGWVMLAVGVGAFLGYMCFPSPSASKSVACH